MVPTGNKQNGFCTSPTETNDFFIPLPPQTKNMDSTLWIIAILVVAALLIRYQWRRHRTDRIGREGERKVARKLRWLNHKKYHVYNNILLPNGNRTSQMDHVIVSRYGIFLLETKNYNGRIIGSERSEYWTQYLWGHKEQLRNPLRQNYGHVLALRALLSRYKSIVIFPIVVFSQRAQLVLDLEEGEVVYVNRLLRHIKRHQTRVLTDEEVEKICRKLERSRITSRKAVKEHVRQIQADNAHYQR